MNRLFGLSVAAAMFAVGCIATPAVAPEAASLPLLVPAEGTTVAQHVALIAEEAGATVVITDQQPCGTSPRPGVYNSDINYLGVDGCYWEDTPENVYLSPAGSEVQWFSLDQESRDVWEYVTHHELAHRDIFLACGMTGPGDFDGERLADAMTYLNTGRAWNWTYGFGDDEINGAEAIRLGGCDIGGTDG